MNCFVKNPVRRAETREGGGEVATWEGAGAQLPGVVVGGVVTGGEIAVVLGGRASPWPELHGSLERLGIAEASSLGPHPELVAASAQPSTS